MSKAGVSALARKLEEEELSGKLENHEVVTYKTMKSLSQLEKSLGSLQEEHAEVYSTLISYINNVVITGEQDFGRSLELNKTSLSSTLSRFHSALKSGKYEKNYEISSRISSILSSLTAETSSIEQTYTYLKNLQTIKAKCKKIHQGLDAKNKSKNLLECSRNLNEIMLLIDNDLEYLDTEFARRAIPTSELPMEPAHFVTKTMNEILIINKTNFDQACKDLYKNSSDSKALALLQESFQIFPLINQHALGLQLYSKYICNIINDKSRDIMVLQKNKLSIPQSLLHLFKMCSMIINSHSKVITDFYGTQSMVTVMENLEKEIDMQSCLILDIFIEKSTSVSNISEGSNDQFLNDFLVILSYWSMFEKFFCIKYNEFSEKSSLQIENKTIEIPACIAENKFISKLNIIIKEKFHSLFQQQIQDNLDKIFSMEIVPNLNDYISSFKQSPADSTCPISSLTDDFSIILKKYLITVINCGDFSIAQEFMSDALPELIIKEGFIKRILSKLANISITPTYLSKYIDSLEKLELSKSNSPNPENENQTLLNAREKMMKTAFSSIQQYATNFKNSSASNIVKEVFSGKQIVGDEFSTDINMYNFHKVLIYMNTIQALRTILDKLLLQELVQDNNILKSNYIFDNHAAALESTIKKSYDSSLEYCDLILKSYTSKIFDIGFGHACHSLGKLLLNGKEPSISTTSPDDPSLISKLNTAYFCTASDFEDLGTMADFVKFWNFISQPYKNVCDPKVYSLILTYVVEYFNDRVLLPKFWSLKRINELGALKLDRELSLLISTVCSSDNYFLREKFDEINQLVLVLGFEMEDFNTNPQTGFIELKSELKESITWSITDEDVNNVRKMRV